MEKTTPKQVSSMLMTKRDIEKILRGEYGAYLPDSKYLTIYFYRDLLSGEKLVSIVLLCSRISNIHESKS